MANDTETMVKRILRLPAWAQEHILHLERRNSEQRLALSRLRSNVPTHIATGPGAPYAEEETHYLSDLDTVSWSLSGPHRCDARPPRIDARLADHHIRVPGTLSDRSERKVVRLSGMGELRVYPQASNVIIVEDV